MLIFYKNRTIYPVSYTHLDVYKRQASELPEEYYIVSARAPYDMMYGSYAWYAINFDADENKFSDIGQAPVSYTHLDVYKRQDFIKQRRNR